jgi:hypothetical protein
VGHWYCTKEIWFFLASRKRVISYNARRGSSERQLLAVFQGAEHFIDRVFVKKRRCNIIETWWPLLTLSADARVHKYSAAV